MWLRLLALTCLVSACSDVVLPDWIPQEKNAGAVAPRATGSATGSPVDGRIPVSDASSASELDQSTPVARQQAARPVSGGQSLGSTIASLGDATETGFWLKTPLVDAEADGLLRSKATGKTAQVRLLPIDGPETAGSRVSLSAMRLLGVPLTELAELEVSLRG